MDTASFVEGVTDVLRNPFFTVPAGAGSTLAAYFIRSATSRERARTHIATQLVDIQRNLADLAFADQDNDIQWSDEKPEWARRMIFRLFARRIDDSKSLAISERLDSSIISLISAYGDVVNLFSEKWFKTERRALGENQGFWNCYNETKKALNDVLKAMGKFQRMQTVIRDAGFADENSSHQDKKPKRNPFGYSVASSKGTSL